MILQTQDLLRTKVATKSKEIVGEQWLKRKAKRESHSALIRSRWDSKWDFDLPAFPGMPERIRLLIEEHNCSFPEDPDIHGMRVFSCSQSEAVVHAGYTACMMPQGFYFLGWKARTLEGIESLFLQGLHFDVAEVAEFSSSLLQDLGGNSFNASCFAVAWLALLIVSSELWLDTAASIARLPASPEAPLVNSKERSMVGAVVVGREVPAPAASGSSSQLQSEEYDWSGSRGTRSAGHKRRPADVDDADWSAGSRRRH